MTLSSSITSSITSSKKEKNTVASAPGFSEFWDKYPRKTAKQDAQKAWAKLKPDTALAEKLTSDVSIRWAGHQKAAIPHAATYLNGARWEDEIIPPLTNGSASRPGPVLVRRLPTMAEVEAQDAAAERGGRHERR